MSGYKRRSHHDLQKVKETLGDIGALNFLIGIEKNRDDRKSVTVSEKIKEVEFKEKKSPIIGLPATTIMQVSQGRDALYAEYINRAEARKSSTVLDSTILRTDSLNGRELLAWRASKGRLNELGIRNLVERARSPASSDVAIAEVVASIDAEWGLRLARIMMLQSARADDRLNALTLVKILRQQPKARVALKNYERLFFDVALEEGDSELARTLHENSHLGDKNKKICAVDIEHPKFKRGDCKGWLEKFNEFFTDKGLEPIALSIDENKSCSKDFFDHIVCNSLNFQSVDGPLVTVIVTSFNPTYALVTAVRSLVNQTYSNLDILIVDDASNEVSSTKYLDLCQKLDRRIRVHRLEINGGTYKARNAGLQLAMGELVTCHDSDDWSHPRKIEKQVESLLKDEKLVGTQSFALKCSPDLILGALGRSVVELNASSYLFNKEKIMNVLGGYDHVRKGADNEIILRTKAAFGENSVLELEEIPLSLVRRTGGSLSREDFRPGWRHPARIAYRRSYEYWHKLIKAKQASPFLSIDEPKRRFPAPASFLSPARKNEFDVVFAGDWFNFGGPQKSMVEEIKALSEHGLRIGICNLEAYRFMTSRTGRPLCEPIAAMLYEGKVEEVLSCDNIGINVLIIRYPLVLQFTPRMAVRWNVKSAFIIANQPPSEDNGEDLRYFIGDCIDNAAKFLGKNPQWVPQGPHARNAIKDLVPRHLLASFDNPGVINQHEWYSARERGGKSVLTIGRCSRDNILKFPDDRETMLKIYPDGPEWKVRMLGAQKSVKTIFGKNKTPSSWEILPYGAISVREFLASIDIFLYFDASARSEAFGRVILEAMASGCIVILPKKFKEVFGNGPIYCQPEEVKDVLQRLRKDVVFFRKTQASIRETVSKKFGYGAFSRWVLAAMGSKKIGEPEENL